MAPRRLTVCGVGRRWGRNRDCGETLRIDQINENPGKAQQDDNNPNYGRNHAYVFVLKVFRHYRKSLLLFDFNIAFKRYPNRSNIPINSPLLPAAGDEIPQLAEDQQNRVARPL